MVVVLIYSILIYDLVSNLDLGGLQVLLEHQSV